MSENATTSTFKELNDQFLHMGPSIINELPKYGLGDGQEQINWIKRILNICNRLNKINSDVFSQDDLNSFAEDLSIVTGIMHNFFVAKREPPTYPNSGRNYEMRIEGQEELDKFLDMTKKIYHSIAEVAAKYLIVEDEYWPEYAQNVESIKLAQEKAITNENKLNKILKDAQQTAGKIGITIYSESFATQATRAFWSAMFWLVITIALAWFTYSNLSAFVDVDVKDFQLNNLIVFVTSRILIVAMLASATLWCGSMFKSMLHQHTVNRFKENALNSFKSFVGATEDQVIKETILLEATRAIYTESPTGFASSDETNKFKPINTVELIKKAVKEE